MAVHPEEHLVVHRPDHAERSIDLLLRQDRQKPRIEAFVRALAAGAQLLENTAWAVVAGGGLDAAEGVTLRRWGELVGEVQGGLTHEEFRTFITLRGRVNVLFPTEDMLWGLLDEALAPFNTVERYLVSDGMVWYVSVPEMPGDAITDHTAGLIRDARPIGFYSAVIVETPDSFGWSSEWGDESVFSECIYDGRSRSQA
jgi:hypothetical protein